MGDTHVGLQARLMSQALRKLAGTLNRTDTICLFTNQLREKIGVMFGNPETTPGGRALKFYSSVRLDIRRIETLKEGVEAIGNRVRVKVVKNKVAPPFKQAEFDIIYGSGISWEGTVLDAGLERKVVTKSGSYFSFGDERLGQGRQNATAFLREHPDVCQGILTGIQVAIGPEQVASGAAPSRRRRRRRRAERQGHARPQGRESRLEEVVPTVTGLREDRRGRVAVELDGAPWRTLPADVVVRAGISCGRALDRPALRRLRRGASPSRGAGSRRPGATGTRPLGPGARAAPGAAGRQPERGGRVARSPRAPPGSSTTRGSRENRAESLAGRGYGDAAIRHDLEQRGVAADLVEAAVAALEPEGERARPHRCPAGHRDGAQRVTWPARDSVRRRWNGCRQRFWTPTPEPE